MKKLLISLLVLMAQVSIAQNWGSWIPVGNGIEVSFQFTKSACASANTRARLRNTSSVIYREVKVAFNTNCNNQAIAFIDAYGFAIGETKESPEDVYTTSLNVTGIVLVKLTDQQYRNVLGVITSGNKPIGSPAKPERQIATEKAEQRQPAQSKPSKDLASASLHELIGLAEQGDAEAQYQLGQRWEKPGASQNHAEALKSFQKAAAQNHLMAQLMIGVLYLYGQGVAKDQIEAERWIVKAVNNPDYRQRAKAYRMLVIMYDTDPSAKDKLTKAISWLEEAVKTGDPVACEVLGEMYGVGRGVAKDETKSFYWYRKATNDSIMASPMALYNLGMFYYNGEGAPKDYRESAEWFTKSAGKQLDEAYIMLYRMHLEGEGYPKDSTEALRWLQKAIDKGLPQAQRILAHHYLNQEKAPDGLYWLEKAAEQSDITATYQLGEYYRRGYYLGGKKEVISEDTRKSYYWFTQLIKLGSKPGLEGIKQL